MRHLKMSSSSRQSTAQSRSCSRDVPSSSLARTGIVLSTSQVSGDSVPATSRSRLDNLLTSQASINSIPLTSYVGADNMRPVSPAEIDGLQPAAQVRVDRLSSTVPIPANISTLDNCHLQEKLGEAQMKFEKACQQIVSLDKKIKDLEVRYKRAVKNKKNSFRYNLRLRLSVITGVKMMYHHYASTKAEELTRLHSQRHSSSHSAGHEAEASTSSDTTSSRSDS